MFQTLLQSLRIDRATFQAAGIALVLAAPVYYTLEAILGFVERALPTRTAPPEVELPAVAAPRLELPLEAEPPAVGPVPILRVADVSGTLRTAEGAPVRNEIVELQSGFRGERYAARSNWRGYFSIPDVAVGRAYQVRVDSEGRYRELTEAVDVPGGGLQLDLVLEPLARTVLTGRMVDPGGAPVPGRTVVVLSSDDPGYALSVTGDDRGRFRVEDAPPGRIRFTAHTLSRLSMRGPLLTPGNEAEVTLVLDDGKHELWGRVVEDRGVPVPGASLKLSWAYGQGEVVSRSTRTAITGPDGEFRFAALASGPHQLEVRARGYEKAREIVEVSWDSGDVELRLRPRGH